MAFCEFALDQFGKYSEKWKGKSFLFLHVGLERTGEAFCKGTGLAGQLLNPDEETLEFLMIPIRGGRSRKRHALTGRKRLLISRVHFEKLRSLGG